MARLNTAKAKRIDNLVANYARRHRAVFRSIKRKRISYSNLTIMQKRKDLLCHPSLLEFLKTDCDFRVRKVAVNYNRAWHNCTYKIYGYDKETRAWFNFTLKSKDAGCYDVEITKI